MPALALVRPSRSGVAPEDRARLFQLASWLLTHPDDTMLRTQGEFALMAACLEHRGVQEQVWAFLDWFAATPRPVVQQHYVDTFDTGCRAGHCLTHHLRGDTGAHGIAPATLRQRYRAHGLRLDGVRPDPMPVLFESAATSGRRVEARRHRWAVELLRGALHAADSPYRHLLEAVSVAMPPLTESDRAGVAALGARDPMPIRSAVPS